MRLPHRLAAFALSAALVLGTSPRLHADAYNGTPKLVIILVFDQMRGDYLDRFRADFHAKNGWNLFLKQGAHYTDCYFDYANLVTAAGHSTIGTGSYTDGHGVPLNQWWQQDRDGKLHEVTSVEDDRYTLVGPPAGTVLSPGASPKNLGASTVGDELVLATGGKARVYGISFKDRASILASGHASRAAFWTDHDSGMWETSTYWTNTLPAWATAFNNGPRIAQARQQANVPKGAFYENVGRTPASVSYQLDFARALIEGEQLGHNPDGATDLITLSISSTDILGHGVGPDGPELRAMIDAADGQLDAFFTFLDKSIGLQNVAVALTADHGVAPIAAFANGVGMPVRSIPTRPMLDSVEQQLQARFKPSTKVKYVLGAEYPWLQIDPAPFTAQGISEADAETATVDAIQTYFALLPIDTKQAKGAPGERLPEPLHTKFAYTATQLRTGAVPATDEGRRELHSYSPLVRWAVHLNFAAYQYPGGDNGATHYSGFSYDRHVPLDFFGAAFKPGTYHGLVQPVDIAATLASILRINQPSNSVGTVRTESMKPEPATPATPLHRQAR